MEIVGFGLVRLIQDFVTIDDFIPPILAADGLTPALHKCGMILMVLWDGYPCPSIVFWDGHDVHPTHIHSLIQQRQYYFVFINPFNSQKFNFIEFPVSFLIHLRINLQA